METLVLDGKTFVKASRAARDLGYTADYVGQLCRSGKVPAHLVGRTWYVDQSELGTHRVEKKRMARVKAREQARKSIEEHRHIVAESTNNRTRKVAIHYEEDKEDLIPTPRKLNVQSESVKKHEKPTSNDDEPAYEIINPGEKIVYSGKLKLIDLNDEDIFDKDTVHLVPRINRKKISESTKERAVHSIVPEIQEDSTIEEVEHEVSVQTEFSEDAPKTQEKQHNFLSRLQNYEVATNNVDDKGGSVSENDDFEPSGLEANVIDDSTEEQSTVEPLNSTPRRDSAGAHKSIFQVIFWILMISTPVFFAVGSLFIEAVWDCARSTTANEEPTITVQYTIDATEVRQLMNDIISNISQKSRNIVQ